MIYNNSLRSQYGRFTEVSSGLNILKTKPLPTETDYVHGYMDRYFVKKINEDVIFETSYISARGVNTNLYKSVNLKWKISGPRNNIYKNGILDKRGVEESNKFEIDRVKKEESVDLSGILTNLLEYWRGR